MLKFTLNACSKKKNTQMPEFTTVQKMVVALKSTIDQTKNYAFHIDTRIGFP